jgi:hypothetical protein
MPEPKPLNAYEKEERFRREFLIGLLPADASHALRLALQHGVAPDGIRAAVQQINDDLSHVSLITLSVEAWLALWQELQSRDTWVATEKPPS